MQGFDVNGTFTTRGNNIVGNGASSFMSGFVNGVNGDKVGTEAAPVIAGLAPLANNGGPTQTHALLASSAALDAGNNGTLDLSFSHSSLMTCDKTIIIRILEPILRVADIDIKPHQNVSALR
jgi:hypothetical protein